MGKSAAFYYETEVEWRGEKAGDLRGPELPSIGVSAPPEFNGRAGQWTPEHLLVAAVNTCFMMTFLAIAENSRIPLVSFSSRARGRLEKVDAAGYQITAIVVAPTVVVASARDLARMPRLLEKAKENCFVGNSLKSTVKVEPEIFHRETQAFPCPPVDAAASAAEPELS